MSGAFLITLREGLEMALIVAIVLAYLKRLGRERDFRSVWLGAAAAAAIALVAGAIIFAAIGELEGRAEEIVEGVVAFAAAAVLTWMIFWMRRQARTIKSELESRIDHALASGSIVAMAGVAFFAVLREGLETALFLIGSTVGDERGLNQVIGGVLGLAIAAMIGFGIYRGSRRVNLRTFFQITGVLIVLFAAGLLAKGIHELNEAGLIGTLNEHVWNVTAIGWLDPETSQFAGFLKALFGWSANPSIEMVVVYFAYLIPVGFAFLGGTRGMPETVRRHAPAEPAAAAIR